MSDWDDTPTETSPEGEQPHSATVPAGGLQREIFEFKFPGTPTTPTPKDEKRASLPIITLSGPSGTEEQRVLGDTLTTFVAQRRDSAPEGLVQQDGQGSSPLELASLLPVGLRALTPPTVNKIDNLWTSLYLPTAQWPVHRRNNPWERGEAEGPGKRSSSFPELQYPTYPPTAEEIAQHHATSFRTLPSAQRTRQPGALTIYIGNGSNAPVTITRVFLRGTAIGDAFLLVSDVILPVLDIPDIPTVEPEVPPDPPRIPPSMAHILVPVVLGQPSSDGWRECIVSEPKEGKCAVLVIVHEMCRQKEAGTGWRKSHKIREDKLYFYGYALEWGELTSFYPSPFELRGRRWPSIEHYFQATKFEGHPAEHEIWEARTCDAAHQLGRTKGPLREDWAEVKDKVMLDALRAKFSQHEHSRKVLLSTGKRRLVFSDPDDSYWGIGKTRTGEPGLNMYGKLLEKVRDELHEGGQQERARLGTAGGFIQVDGLEVVGFDAEAPEKVMSPSLHLLRIRERITTPLYLCALNGWLDEGRRQLEIVKKAHSLTLTEGLLRMGIPTGEISGSTALHVAAKQGFVDFVALLLEYRGDPSVQNDHQSTPMHAAARGNHVAVVSLLLKDARAQGTLLVADSNGYTPLMVAIEHKKRDVVRCLLRAKSSATIHQLQERKHGGAKDGASALHLAARKLDHQTCTMLLSVLPDLIHSVTTEMETPLMWALRASLRNGNDDEDEDEDDEKLEAFNKHLLRVVDLLLQRAADVTARNSRKETAVHLAAAQGYTAALSKLLNHLEDVSEGSWLELLSSASSNGDTPLIMAARNNHIETMNFIVNKRWRTRTSMYLRKGIDFDMDLVTALQIAGESGHTEIVKEFGGKLRQRTRGKDVDWTLTLLCAADANNIDLVKHLMAIDTSPALRLNRDTARPSDYARFGDSTALMVAARKGYHDVVWELLAQAEKTMSEKDITDWFCLCRENSMPTPILAAIHSYGSSPEPMSAVDTVATMLEFAVEHGIDIHTTMNDNETWYVIAPKGTEALIEETGGTRKHPLQRGQHVEVQQVVTEGLSRKARITHPVEGWVQVNEDTNIILAQEETPLHAAICTGEPRMVEEVIEYYKKDLHRKQYAIEMRDRTSLTPLLLAVKKRQEKIIKYLLKEGADPSGTNSDGETVVHVMAQWSGDHREVETVLDTIEELMFKEIGKEGRRFWGLLGNQERRDTLSLSLAPESIPVAKQELATSLPTSNACLQLLLQKTAPLDGDPLSALQVACKKGAQGVVRWILKRYTCYFPRLNMESRLQIDADCRKGFEIAAMWLANLRSMTASPLGRTNTWFTTPQPATAGSSLNHAAIINLMLQHEVPFPATVVAGGEESIDGEPFIDPLVYLFECIVKLPVSHFLRHSGGISRPRLILPLRLVWAPTEQSFERTTVCPHMVLMALSRLLVQSANNDTAHLTAGHKNMFTDIPFHEVELRMLTYREEVRNELLQIGVVVDMVQTQCGVHVQFSRSQWRGPDFRVRMKRDIMETLGVRLWLYDVGHTQRNPVSAFEEEMHYVKLGEDRKRAPYAFLSFDRLELLNLQDFLRDVLDSEGMECCISKNEWVPLRRQERGYDEEGSRSDDRRLHQVHTLSDIANNPFGVDRYDRFFQCLTQMRKAEGSYELVGSSGWVWTGLQSSAPAASLFSTTLLNCLWYEFIRPQASAVRVHHLDIRGVVLEERDLKRLEYSVKQRTGPLARLESLLFSTRSFGPVEVRIPACSEVRPLGTALGDSFVLDIKFLTCTSVNTIPRCVYKEGELGEGEGTYYFDGSSFFEEQDEESMRRAEENLQHIIEQCDLKIALEGTIGQPLIDELLTHGIYSIEKILQVPNNVFERRGISHRTIQKMRDRALSRLNERKEGFAQGLTRHNYTTYLTSRKDVLLHMVTSRILQREANESLDVLKSQGKGLQLDLTQFKGAGYREFQADYLKDFFEYMRRHPAIHTLRFVNLNFVDPSAGDEGSSVRQFLVQRILRGLPCRVIDFGHENVRVGEIFMTVATSSSKHMVDSESEDGEGLGPTYDDDPSPVSPLGQSVSPLGPRPAVPQSHSDMHRSHTDDGSDAADSNRQESFAMETDDSKRGHAIEGQIEFQTPLTYFVLEGVNFLISDHMRAYPLHYLIALVAERRQAVDADEARYAFAPEHDTGEALSPDTREVQMRRDLYRSTKSVCMKTISYLNTHDPNYFLKYCGKKFRGVTPLRLAIHLGLDEVVSWMVGGKKDRHGLLRRHLSYPKEKIEMDHNVDIWRLKERDGEHLMSLHASLLQVGVQDYKDGAAQHISRLKVPFQLYSGPRPSLVKRDSPLLPHTPAKRISVGGTASTGGLPEGDSPPPRTDTVLRMSPANTPRSSPRNSPRTSPPPSPNNPELSARQRFALKLNRMKEGITKARGSPKASPGEPPSLMIPLQPLAPLAPPVNDSEIVFHHPKDMSGLVQSVSILKHSDTLKAEVESHTDLGEREFQSSELRRAVAIARTLLHCSFVERTVTIAGNTMQRGCASHQIMMPCIIDKAESSYFSGRLHKVELSPIFDRSGANDDVLPNADKPEMATTVLLVLKFAPYVLPDLLESLEHIDLKPNLHLGSSWKGIIIQYRSGFHQMGDEDTIGQVHWEMEDTGLGLAHWAAIRGQKKLLEHAIAKNRNCLKSRTSLLKWTALHMACYAGAIDCVALLLSYMADGESDADMHSKDYFGNTALHIATAMCHYTCTELLCSSGAKPFWKNTKQAGSVDCHDISVALLLHHDQQEDTFRQLGEHKDWEKGQTLLKNQITLLNKDTAIQRKLAVHAAKSFLMEASFYILFIVLLFFMVNHKTNLFDSGYYYAVAGVEAEVIQEEFLWEDTKIHKTLEDVGSVEEMWQFLRGPFVQQLFPPPGSTSMAHLFGILQLVGSVRLRQLRVRKNTCDWPRDFVDFDGECFGKYSPTNEQTGGTYKGAKYVYQSEALSDFGWRSAMYKSYPMRGYVVDLHPSNTTAAIEELRRLEQEGWVDIRTRAVFVDFTLFNPNIGKFIVGNLLFETPEYGGCHPTSHLTLVRMHTCVVGNQETTQLNCATDYDTFIFFLECLITISVVFLTYDEIYDMKTSWTHVSRLYKEDKAKRTKDSQDEQKAVAAVQSAPMRLSASTGPVQNDNSLDTKYSCNFLTYVWQGVFHYLLREWNLIDLLSVSMFWLVFSIRVRYIVESLEHDLNKVLTATDKYFNFTNLAVITTAERDIWAVVLFLFFVKLLKYVMILPKLGSVATAITSTIADPKVMIFFVVFMVISISLMLAIHLVLGTTTAGMRSFGETIVSYTQIVFGQWEYVPFKKSSWFFGPMIFLLTIFLANLVLINVFIAVVGNIYEQNLRKSLEDWSWQIVDQYKYQLTGVSPPKNSGNPMMALCNLLFNLLRRCWLLIQGKPQKREVLPEGEPLPPRVMRREAISRAARSQQRVQTSLGEVYDSVEALKERVTSNSAALQRVGEQVDKVSSYLRQLQAYNTDIHNILTSQQIHAPQVQLRGGGRVSRRPARSRSAHSSGLP